MLRNISSFLFNKRLSTVTAKNRLQMVLVQDRSGLSPNEMDNFKRDLLDVISKYFSIETSELEVDWRRSETETSLLINTPIAGKIHVAKQQAAVGTT